MIDFLFIFSGSSSQFILDDSLGGLPSLGAATAADDDEVLPPPELPAALMNAAEAVKSEAEEEAGGTDGQKVLTEKILPKLKKIR